MAKQKRKDSALSNTPDGFDAEQIEALEKVMAKLKPASGIVEAMIIAAADDDPMIQVAATWMLKGLAARSADLSESQLELFFGSLSRLHDWQAKLHVCQMLQYVAIPEASQKNVSLFLERELEDENKFLRAWAYSGLFEVSKQFKSYSRRAKSLIDQGEADERAGSVKAHVRANRKTMEKQSSKTAKVRGRTRRD